MKMADLTLHLVDYSSLVILRLCGVWSNAFLPREVGGSARKQSSGSIIRVGSGRSRRPASPSASSRWGEILSFATKSVLLYRSELCHQWQCVIAIC
jgi:hypothetical protein